MLVSFLPSSRNIPLGSRRRDVLLVNLLFLLGEQAVKSHVWDNEAKDEVGIPKQRRLNCLRALGSQIVHSHLQVYLTFNKLFCRACYEIR